VLPLLSAFDLLAMPALDLKGCIEDSPIFRRRIAAHEESISNFDSSLKSLAKLVKSQIDLSTGTDSPLRDMAVLDALLTSTIRLTEYSQRQSQIAYEFTTIAQGQDDPIVGKYLWQTPATLHMCCNYIRGIDRNRSIIYLGHALEKFAKSLTEVEKCRNLMVSFIIISALKLNCKLNRS
jgi:Arf-GAP/coiled-coil/ANK repeat/PH domain-containing protein